MDASPPPLAAPALAERPPSAGPQARQSDDDAGGTRETDDLPNGSLRRRAAVALLVLGALVAIAASDPMHRALTAAVGAVEPVVTEHPVEGAFLFVVLSALSALLAFFSSGALVPVALDVWGPWGTAALLWTGWMLGGMAAYAAGRVLGAPLLARFDRSGAGARSLSRLGPDTPLWIVALLMVALQSEVSGLVLGTARYPTRRYLPALAVVEAGFAALTIGAGQGLVGRDTRLLIGAGALFIGAGVLAVLLLRWRLPPAD